MIKFICVLVRKPHHHKYNQTYPQALTLVFDDVQGHDLMGNVTLDHFGEVPGGLARGGQGREVQWQVFVPSTESREKLISLLARQWDWGPDLMGPDPSGPHGTMGLMIRSLGHQRDQRETWAAHDETLRRSPPAGHWFPQAGSSGVMLTGSWEAV